MCNLQAIDMLKKKLESVNDVQVKLENLPPGVKRVFAGEIAGRVTTQHQPTPSTSGVEDTRIEGLDAAFTKQLFPYQRKGVM